MGVTWLHNVVYIICEKLSTIRRFDTTTHAQLTDINIPDLKDPKDIAACKQTSQVYIADSECVWRMSSDGTAVERWLTTPIPSRQFSPHTLSVTASRLLVTSYAPNELMQFDTNGIEQRRVSLLEGKAPYHAVESPAGKLVVVHSNVQQKEWQVSEVDTNDQVLPRFSKSLNWPCHIAVDSQGNVFVADTNNSRILLLDAQLVVFRVIIDKFLLNIKNPRRLCYVKETGQLLVGLDYRVAMFDLLQVCHMSQLTLSKGIFHILKSYVSLKLWGHSGNSIDRI